MHASTDAVAGALIAHFARLKSDVGQYVEVSAQQSVTQCTLSRILATAVGDPNFEKIDSTYNSQQGEERVHRCRAEVEIGLNVQSR